MYKKLILQNLIVAPKIQGISHLQTLLRALYGLNFAGGAVLQGLRAAWAAALQVVSECHLSH